MLELSAKIYRRYEILSSMSSESLLEAGSSGNFCLSQDEGLKGGFVIVLGAGTSDKIILPG
jgi:hypothetical protein